MFNTITMATSTETLLVISLGRQSCVAKPKDLWQTDGLSQTLALRFSVTHPCVIISLYVPFYTTEYFLPY